jgi:hypothetical protein
VARVHAHPRSMVPKMDLLQVLYAISGSLLRNCFVSPLWIRQTDTQGHQQRVLSRFFSLLLPLPTAADSPLLLYHHRKEIKDVA